MANGILHVKYIDDEQARNISGFAIHIWEDVNDFGFLYNGLNLLRIDLNDQARKIVYIPMSNVAMVEWFESMEDFEKAYPRVR